jgi:holo-[acyl-carrier protein] synthase
MVVGVGVDIVEVARIENAIKKRDRFVRRILTEREEVYCTTAEKVAGRWAAKEAIVKALGIKFHPSQIEIINDPLGQPHVSFYSHQFDSKRLRVFVSISHEKKHAVAVAVVERAVLQVPMV